MAVRELINRDDLRWVDVVDPTSDELAELTSEFGLHALAIEDITEPGQRPKLELYENHAFLVAYASNLAEVDMFIGEHWVVTVRERAEDGAVWEPTAARMHCDRYKQEHVSVGTIVHAVLDDIVDGYFAAGQVRLPESADSFAKIERDVPVQRARLLAMAQQYYWMQLPQITRGRAESGWR